MAVDSRTTSASSTDPAAADGVVCPFCAHVRPGVTPGATGGATGGACPKCTMEDTAGTRRSTGERIGPWFVLQRKNPTAPGLRFSVLLTLARRGHVTPRSIVRGPTTGQLWRYAGEVKGLSRLFGVCWHCKGGVSPDATTCPRCKSAQEIPDDPDVFLESHETLPVMREVAAPGTAVVASMLGSIVPSQAIEGREEQHWSAHALAATSREQEHRQGDSRAGRSADRRADRLADRKAPPLDEERALARARRDRTESFDNVDDLTRALAPGGPTGAAARGGGRGTVPAVLSAGELAAAFQLDAPRPGFAKRARRAAWRLTKAAAAVVLVVGVAGAATAYLKPDWADRATVEARTRGGPYVARAQAAWADVYARVRGTATDEAATDEAATDETATDETATAATPIVLDTGAPADVAAATRPAASVVTPSIVTPSVVAPATRPARPIVAAATPSAIDAPGGQASSFPPATRPTTRRATPPQIANRPADVAVEPKIEVTRKPAEKSAEKPAEKAMGRSPDPTKSPDVVSGPPKALTLDEAIAQATELRNSALDAEARRDWRAAIVIYEQIATLPEAARPSDLKVRLAVARERLAGS